MKYRINKTNYCSFDTISINELQPRSYFIPYPDRASSDAASGKAKRYSSPMVKCLNGDWDFRFYPLPAEIPDVLDTDNTDFDKIDVPSCWQFRGYDKPFYVNTRYQFPFDPPKIPETEKVGRTFCWTGADKGTRPRWTDPGEEYNFAGIYRTFFTAEDLSKKHILSFLGVASCADIYVNGRFAGYTEGAHNTAEFYVSHLIHEGENELVVVVRRWCNGTYLECQDMFRNNGIFRDVLLRIEDRDGIRDIDFACEKTSDGYTARLKAEMYADNEVTFTLKGHGIEVTKTVRSEDNTAEAVFEGLDVTEWNAEKPVLYDIYYETAGECIHERAGFRTVTIEGDIFLINGRKVKLHGVNHHDTSSVNGYTMTPEEIERDMLICKEYNIDTVRTSHYPPDPYLLEVCDEIGIYIVDEADIETHGTFSMQLPATYNTISHDPKWEAHYLDRAEHLYQRDKLHTSIVMWSLGNEAGGYNNTDKMYGYLKSRSSLPVHYESAVHCRRKAYDVASEMYPPVERVHEIGEKTYKIREMCDRPYFLCEYAHAMGVGPGDMEAYWKEIYTHDSLFGGCVWEMVDHAVLHEDGSYTYGGDHGEWEHDGNFCVDGMFYPDRTPSTGARIAKFIYRPLRVRHLGRNLFEIFNTKSFTDGSEYEMKLKWSDGHEETLVPDVKPLGKVTVDLDESGHRAGARQAGRDCLLDIITTEKATGREVSREQLVLEERIPGVPAGTGTVQLSKFIGSDGADIVEAAADTGDAPEVILGGIPVRPGEPYTIIFRAPTDNDFILYGAKNSMKEFSEQKEEITSVEKTDGKAVIKSRITTRRHAFTCTDTYEAVPEGILVTSRLKCTKGRGNLPRFGKAFRLDSSYDRVRYLGRNGESYADMKDQTQIEEVSCRVKDMTEPNIKPQESGNRMDCRWASVSNGKKTLTFTAAGRSFELGIKRYSDTELLGMKHREDEVTTGTYVTVSAFQQGIGTGICGPQTAPEYCYPAKGEYELKFLISTSDTGK